LLPVEEGYVTGLEPATGYPNFKAFEREKGRVRTIPPGGHWLAQWSLEATDTPQGVIALQTEVASLQAHAKALIHRTPQPKYTPGV
ncbi:MAG: aldose 1-epimerase family protein, partial [Gemmataceae bacterium]